MFYTIDGKVPTRMGNADSGIAPFDSFRAKDGQFVMGCGTDKMWASLCYAMGREDLIEDPRYITNDDRCKNYLPDLKKAIEEWSMLKMTDELEKIIIAAGIPFGKINDIGQICNHPQLKRRNMLWNVFDPNINAKIDIPGCPIKIHGTADAIQKAAPKLGEDTESVLVDWLGYSKEKAQCIHNSK